MDLALELCERLCEYSYLRRVVYYATDRPGWWARTFLGDRLSGLVYTVKLKEEEALHDLFDSGFWSMLSSGRTLGFEAKVVPWLDFSNPGRLTASLALLAHIVDCVDKQSSLSPDFILDVVCAPVCHRIKALVHMKKLQLGSSEDSLSPVVEEVE